MGAIKIVSAYNHYEFYSVDTNRLICSCDFSDVDRRLTLQELRTEGYEVDGL